MGKLSNFTSHYGRSLTLATGLTKAQLWKEFLPDKNNASQTWFNKYWQKNILIKNYSNHVDTCDICNNNTLSYILEEKNSTIMITTKQ